MASKSKTPEITIYQWQGVNRRGAKAQGEMQGNSALEVKAQLRKQGINPSKVRKKAGPLFGIGGDKPISALDICIFSRQMATMLGAGVPLVQSLDMIASGNRNMNMRTLVASLSQKVQSGTSYSEALREHPKFFDDLYCDLIYSGEQSGALDRTYDRVATYKEKAEALKSKVKKALIYPTAVIVVSSLVTAILLIFVVPQFQEIFESFNAELPVFTQFIIFLSEGLQAYWHFVLVTLGIGFYTFKKSHERSPKFRDYVDDKLLKMPVFGFILHKAAIARFARTLSTTFAAGVPLIDALQSAAGASGNAVYRDVINDIRHEVSSGNQMNYAMNHSGLFPEMVTQMVAIGEESGAVDEMLRKIADIYEQEVNDAVDGLASLIEPMIMVFLGVVIGGLIVAMYLPIFQIGTII